MKVIGRIVSFWGLWVALWVLAPLAAGAQTKEEFEVKYSPLVCAKEDVVPEFVIGNNKYGYAPFKNGTFTIDWGDGSAKEIENKQEMRHQYAKFGKYQITLTYEEGATIIPVVYDIELRQWFRSNLYLKSSSNCIGAPVEFEITNYDKKTSETTYKLEWNGNTLGEWNDKEVKSQNGIIKYAFKRALCNDDVFLRVNDGCSESTGEADGGSTPVTVLEPLRVDFEIEQTPVCTGIGFVARAISLNGNVCDKTIDYSWDFEDNAHYSGRVVDVKPYLEAGEYQVTLTASVGQYACATSPPVSKTLKVIKRAVALFDTDKTDYCVDGQNPPDIKLTDKSSGDETTVNWLLNGGNIHQGRGNWTYDKLKDYGIYTFTQHVYNSCSDSTLSKQVEIKQDPDIRKFELPDKVCAGSFSVNGDMVDYVWNGNEGKAVWTVEFEGKSSTREETYPFFDFSKPGIYTLSVALTGVGCGGTTLNASKTIEVVSTEITGTTTPDKAPVDGTISLCDGDNLGFSSSYSNPSGAALSYTWEAVPTGEYAEQLAVTCDDWHKADPQFTFTGYGDCIIRLTVGMELGCNGAVEEFRVHVGKEPVIIFLDLPEAVCPEGFIVDMNYYVDYDWYNNTTKEVEWKFTSSEGDGVKWVNGNEHSLKPLYSFVKKDHSVEYEVQLTLKSTAGCSTSGMKTATDKVRVKASALKSSVTAVPASLKVCEGESIVFTNRAEDPENELSYLWRVNSSGAYEIKPEVPTARATIIFEEWGDYEVVAEVAGACEVKKETFNVTVYADAKVKLASKEICPGSTLQMSDLLDVLDWVNYEESQRTVEWTIKDPQGGVHTNNNQNWEFLFEHIGDYEIMVSVPGSPWCTGSPITDIKNVHVFDTTIHADVKMPGYDEGRGICVGETLAFENNTTAERELKWHWSVEDAAGGYSFDGISTTSEGKAPTLVFSIHGNYVVRLVIEEGCNTKVSRFPLTVRGVPTLNLKDQAGCEEGFRFVGNDEIKAPALDLKNNELLGTHWDVSVEYGEGAYKWEDGGENAQYPTIAFTPVPSSGRCIYRVNVEYENHCSEPTRASFAVRIDEKVKIEPLVNEDICELVEARRLQVAVPDSGVWELVDASLPAHVLEWREDGYYFNPDFSAYEDKEVRLRYTIQNGACTSTDEMTMRVHALPFVDGGRDLQMCYNQEPLPLVGRDSIKGGHWQENRGIWKLGKADLENRFDITKWDAIPGDYPLTYEYTYIYDNGYQCTNMDEVVLTVQRLPEKEFAVLDTLCVGVEGEFVPKELDGNAFEWCFDFLYAPTAKEESKEEGILHAYDRHGSYTVRCVASRPYPYHESMLVCRDTSEKMVTVLRNPPAVYFDVDKTEGCAPLNIHLTVDAPYYDTLTFADFTYTWDFGNGEQDVTRTFGNGELLKTYQSSTWDTTYVLSLTVGNRCKTFRHDTTVIVFSVPKVGMAPAQDWECSPVEAEVKNTTTGNNCKFTWTISNDRNDQIIGDLHTYNFNYHLETDSATTVYAIKLHAENICATDDSTIYIKVKPQTLEAHFSTLDDRYACEREEIYFRNNSTDTATNILVTKWTFGDGHVSEEWELLHPYDKAGVYPVVLWINNGCGWAADTQQVYIDPLPKLSIVSQDTLCEDEEFHFAFEADMDLSLFEWKLRDTLIKRDSFEYTFKGYGSFPVTFIGTAGEGTFTRCQDSVIKTVVVNNKPIMTILPLDTAVCSPLDYVPFVEGEYETLLWDYGDGTEVTSESAHYYTNRGDSALRYSVAAFVTTDKGCYSEFVRGVTVYNTPVAGLEKEVESGRPQRVTFLNLSEGADAGHWILPLSGEVYSVENQTESFMENGVYPVTLIVSNRYGCADTITLEHEVDMHGLYFPNTFIPHSLNDKINRFNGIGMGLRSYHLEILDQYGNVLWMTEELEDGKPVGGWDGTNRKGQRMPQGIYIWRAKAIFGNDDIWTGDNNDSGIPEYTQGTVLLLRE